MKPINRLYAMISLVALTILLLVATTTLPERGDPHAPMHREVSAAGKPGAGAYVIANAYTDSATPNMVTVVLGDYRSFDTLGEVFVVFAAAVACFLILRRKEET